jgi:cob(I)alamin adenosyltransferase
MTDGKIYTRRGDAGETSVVGGARIPKNSPRICACGSVDEVNSHVGLARTAVDDDLLARILTFVQHRLFNCSSSLASPARTGADRMSHIGSEDVATLERVGPRVHQPPL